MKKAKIGIAGMRVFAIMMMIISVLACGGSALAPKAPASKEITGDPNRSLVKGTCVQKGETEEAKADFVECLKGKQDLYDKVLAGSTASPPVETPPAAPPATAASAATSVPSPLSLLFEAPAGHVSPLTPPPAVGPYYHLPVTWVKTYSMPMSGKTCGADVSDAHYVYNNLLRDSGGIHGWIIPRGQVMPMLCDLGDHFVPALIIPRGTTTPTWEWAIPPGMETAAAMHFTGRGVIELKYEVYRKDMLPDGTQLPGGLIYESNPPSFTVPKPDPGNGPYTNEVTPGLVHTPIS